MFDHRWLTLSTPRRVEASSMTSSVVHATPEGPATATAPVTTSVGRRPVAAGGVPGAQLPGPGRSRCSPCPY